MESEAAHEEHRSPDDSAGGVDRRLVAVACALLAFCAIAVLALGLRHSFEGGRVTVRAVPPPRPTREVQAAARFLHSPVKDTFCPSTKRCYTIDLDGNLVGVYMKRVGGQWRMSPGP